MKTPRPEAAAVLRPILPSLAAEIIAALREEVPEYDRPLRGPFGVALHQGVEQALSRFADIIEDPARSRRIGREIYVNLGRGERVAGRSLEALLSAYRTGARIAWRRAVEAGVEGGLDPQDMYALGEAIFAYIDELSAESADGYAQEQSREAGERSRRLRAVMRALLALPQSAAEVAAAAADLGWTVPQRLAVLVGAEDAAGRLSARLEATDLVSVIDEETVVILSDPEAPGLRKRLERLTREGQVFGLGPTQDPADAAVGLARARAARALGIERSMADGTPGCLVRSSDHLPALLLRSDATLAAELADDVLAPLADETPASAEKLRATLVTWLDEQGRIETVARVLDIHPQTVRYRLGRLRDLFGERLDDPEGRFALTLALRC